MRVSFSEHSRSLPYWSGAACFATFVLVSCYRPDEGVLAESSTTPPDSLSSTSTMGWTGPVPSDEGDIGSSEGGGSGSEESASEDEATGSGEATGREVAEEIDGSGGGTSESSGPIPGAPEPPLLEISYGIKSIRFDWENDPGAIEYRLFRTHDVDGESSLLLDLPPAASSAELDVPVHLLDWGRDAYWLEVCNDIGCVSSSPVVPDRGDSVWTVGYVKGSELEGGHHFGSSVAISGDGSVLAVGAPDANGAGVVYVFAKIEGRWVEETILSAANIDPADGFGSELAMSRDGATIAVGVPFEDGDAENVGGDSSRNQLPNSGAVYVFSRLDSGWSEPVYLKSSQPGQYALFGGALSLSGSGDVLAVGAVDEGEMGAVYVYVRSGPSWSLPARVTPSLLDLGDSFGGSVSISDDGLTLAVASSREDSSARGINGDRDNDDDPNSGAVYVFQFDGGWTESAFIKGTADDDVDHRLFGGDLDLSAMGDVLAVDARVEGVSYLFYRSGASWSGPDVIRWSSEERSEFPSLSLSADGRFLAIGNVDDSSDVAGVGGERGGDGAPGSGAVFMFEREGADWSERAYVKASNPGSVAAAGGGDQFGKVVDLSADGMTLVVGVAQEDSRSTEIGGEQNDETAPESGAVYLY